MKTIGLLAIVTLWLCGCSSMPPVPVASKGQAVALADVSRLPGPSQGEVRMELPARSTGHGKHDFYNLFAQYHKGKQIVYGLSIATSAHNTGPSTTVLVNGIGPLPVASQEEIPLRLFSKVNYLEVRFSREFVEQSAVSGRYFTLHGAEGTYEFQVPDWMFAALLQGLEKRLPEMRKLSFNVEEVMTRSDIRHQHVAEHPEMSEFMQEAVLYGEVAEGMNTNDVQATWGSPEMVQRGKDDKGAFEVWRYPGVKLVLEKGQVTGWQKEQ